MKKLVLLLAVAFSVSMFSCGGGEAGNGADSDSIKKADSIAAAQKAADEKKAPETGETPAPEAPADSTAAQK